MRIMGRRFTRGGLFLVRQALARHDWGFEGLRAEPEGCAAGTATPSSKLKELAKPIIFE